MKCVDMGQISKNLFSMDAKIGPNSENKDLGIGKVMRLPYEMGADIRKGLLPSSGPHLGTFDSYSKRCDRG